MIYHYTSIEGLLGILNTHALWAADPLYLNDAQELSHGAHLIRSFIGPNGVPTCLAQDRLSSVPAKNLRRLRSELDERYPESGEIQTFHEDSIYLVSFTKKRDNLDMWRGYAPGRGFSLGFDKHILIQSCNVGSKEEASELFPLTSEESERLWQSHIGLDHSLLKVRYDDNQFIKEIRSFCSSPEITFEDKPRLSRFLAKFKDKAFKGEKEMRLIANPKGDLSPRVSIRASRTNLVPYIPLEFAYSALKSVTVGPGPYAARSLRALKTYFSDGLRGEWDHVDLKTSSVPYIG